MMAASITPSAGALTPADYSALEARWITAELANAAGIRRIDSLTGRDVLGRKSGNLAGLLIPNVLPGMTFARENRVRLDEPEGKRKYLSPIGRPNLAYFAPIMSENLLANTTVPLILTEGEFKTLALWRLAMFESELPRFLPVGFPGVWAFRGTVGKTTSSKGDRVDVRGVIPDLERVQCQGRKTIIAFDADATSNEQVRNARFALARALRGRGAKVAFLEWDQTKGKGIDDYLATIGPEVVLKEIETLDFEHTNWEANMIRNQAGRPQALLANAVTALREAPEWSGLLAFNEFSLATVALKPPPWTDAVQQWTDRDDLLCCNWLQHHGVYVMPKIAGQAVQAVARDRSFHPVREYLKALTWDGITRVDDWLLLYLSADSSDYTRAVAAKFLISAVARIFRPGCKSDCTIILEGPQGALKSTALETLFDPWFTDDMPELGTKDASLQVRGVWCIELSELDSMTRGEVSRVKSFLSRATDRFRVPYGTHPIEAPRQNVFAGTVNQDGYLRDETGGRRFWPVRCGTIRIPELKRDRDQLWAEARTRFEAGATWWLDDIRVVGAAAAEQEARYEGDVWDELIQPWLLGRETVSVSEILLQVIDKPKERWMQGDKNRIARILRATGWERFQVREDSQREWRYRRASGDNR